MLFQVFTDLLHISRLRRNSCASGQVFFKALTPGDR